MNGEGVGMATNQTPEHARAFKHADGSNGPVALIMGGNCVEIPAYAKD